MTSIKRTKGLSLFRNFEKMFVKRLGIREMWGGRTGKRSD